MSPGDQLCTGVTTTSAPLSPGRWGGGPSPAPSVAGISGPLSPNPFGAGCWLQPGAPAPGHPALPGPGEGEHLIKKMELPQAPCLNSCSAVMTNSRSQGLRSRGGALSHLCSQSPRLPGAQLPGHRLAPSWCWGAARASLTFSSQNRFPAPLLPACSPLPHPAASVAVMAVPLTQAEGGSWLAVCTLRRLRRCPGRGRIPPLS